MLNSVQAWSAGVPADENQWMIIDAGEVESIGGIAVQKRVGG
jgi:hypothetical protein